MWPNNSVFISEPRCSARYWGTNSISRISVVFRRMLTSSLQPPSRYSKANCGILAQTFEDASHQAPVPNQQRVSQRPPVSANRYRLQPVDGLLLDVETPLGYRHPDLGDGELLFNCLEIVGSRLLLMLPTLLLPSIFRLLSTQQLVIR